MAEVGATSAAIDLDALHIVGEIVLVGHGCGTDGFKEAGPSTFTGKFSFRSKEGVSADSAIIGTLPFKIPVLSCKSAFCSFPAGYFKHIGGKDFLPFCIRYMQGGGVCAGIIWIIAMGHCWQFIDLAFDIVARMGTGEEQGKKEYSGNGFHTVVVNSHEFHELTRKGNISSCEFV